MIFKTEPGQVEVGIGKKLGTRSALVIREQIEEAQMKNYNLSFVRQW